MRKRGGLQSRLRRRERNARCEAKKARQEAKALQRAAEPDDTGDKGPNTHWVHSENIESTVNM